MAVLPTSPPEKVSRTSLSPLVTVQSKSAASAGGAATNVTTVASRLNSTTSAIRDKLDAEAKAGIIFLPEQLVADHPSGLAGIHGDV